MEDGLVGRIESAFAAAQASLSRRARHRCYQPIAERGPVVISDQAERRARPCSTAKAARLARDAKPTLTGRVEDFPQHHAHSWGSANLSAQREAYAQRHFCLGQKASWH